jgi:hypothetical protein
LIPYTVLSDAATKQDWVLVQREGHYLFSTTKNNFAVIFDLQMQV